MRRVPASVAVITVAHHDPETNKHVPMGIAVSSLSTVTLDPPTVSFNIKQPSQALNAIRAADGHLRVHFLAASKMGRKIVEGFCNGNHPAAYRQRTQDLQIHVPESKTMAPKIQGPGVSAAADCILTQEMTVGDHVILVAQVHSLENNDRGEPTVAYVDGTYRSLQSALVIGQHGDPQPQATMKPHADLRDSSARELSLVHDFPLFPSEQDRCDHAERLKAYFKGFQIGNTKDFLRQLQPETKHVSKTLGIDLEALIHSCKEGPRKKLPHKKGQQTLPEFHGQLSSAQLIKVVNRAKAFVKANAQFLKISYADLLRHLDVKVGHHSLLPSDILNSLREEGLVDPFQVNTLLFQTNDRRDIFYMEQAEHALREHLRTLTDREILRSSLPVALEQAGVNTKETVHFLGSYTRLKTELCSNFYEGSHIDITGDVTPEEARVVVWRLVNYLNIHRRDRLKTNLREDVADMMLKVGVHPLVTGVDANLLISKVQYLDSSTEPDSAFVQKVEEMLQPYFASDVTWEDLQARINQFVHKFPMRAVAWKIPHMLAAMGLKGNTTITTPLSSTSQTLDKSDLVETLIAKALKTHYGHGTDEENEAIATFLKEQYNFDVVSKSVTVTPEQLLARSSADDLEAARLANEEVTVPLRKHRA